MPFDPNEPRDKDGKWVGGGARGHNAGRGNRSLVDRISTQHQRDTVLAVVKGAAHGIAEGVVLSAALGAVTGGYGSLAAPGLIARAAIKGAIAGSKLHPVHAALAAGIGGTAGLQAHKARMKAAVSAQHKKGE
jgi:hypothetical protein